MVFFQFGCKPAPYVRIVRGMPCFQALPLLTGLVALETDVPMGRGLKYPPPTLRRVSAPAIAMSSLGSFGAVTDVEFVYVESDFSWCHVVSPHPHVVRAGVRLTGYKAPNVGDLRRVFPNLRHLVVLCCLSMGCDEKTVIDVIWQARSHERLLTVTLQKSVTPNMEAAVGQWGKGDFAHSCKEAAAGAGYELRMDLEKVRVQR